MPRDDSLTTELIPRTNRFEPSGSVNVYNLTNHLSDRSRALPVSTIPNSSGEFYLPTNYRAHRWSGVGNHMDYTMRSSIGTTQRVTGKSSTSDWPWPLRTWGLSTVTRPYTVMISPGVVTSAEQRAMSALKKGTNLAVVVAEFNKSFKTILKILKLLRAIIRGFRPHLLDDGDLADLWLLYRYFFVTSMMDIYGVMEGVQNLLSKEDLLTSRVEQVDHDFSIWPTAPTNWWHYKATGTFRRGCNVELSARISNPTIYALDAFGILNPALVAWELVPFSFVIDWFISIGPWLGSLTAPWGMTFSSGYKTLWLKYNYNIEYVPTNKQSGYTLKAERYANLSGNVDAFARFAYGGFPSPFISIDARLSAKQVLDGLALLVGSGRPVR